nr:PREDICTED: disrupted in schizophrenia 1 protein isoform X1 [Lepisosteus oculatus]
MFTGMVKVGGEVPSMPISDTDSITHVNHRHHAGFRPGDPVLVPRGSSSRRKKLYRRPGYMRGGLQEQRGLPAELVSKRPCQRPAKNGEVHRADSGCSVPAETPKPSSGQHHVSGPFCSDSPSSQSCLVVHESPRRRQLSKADQGGPGLGYGRCFAADLPQEESASAPGSNRKKPESDRELEEGSSRLSGAEEFLGPPGEPFSSSFSFIRLSLISSRGPDSVSEPSEESGRLPSTAEATGGQIEGGSVSPGRNKEDFLCAELWRDGEGPSWEKRRSEGGSQETRAGMKESLRDSDSISLDTEATSCLSADSSDAASAGSSVTSGYESSTPCSDHGWDALMKKYEAVLQDCLQGNRTNIKIESMILKLKRLQENAILEDDYDRAERFRNKLDELRREKSSLTAELPSRHPAVSRLLERLRDQVTGALQEVTPVCRPSNREGQQWQKQERDSCSHLQCPVQRREQILQEKQQIEKEIHELKRKLSELEARSSQLDRQVLEEEQLMEYEDSEELPLVSFPPGQLQDLSRALDDLVGSEHRAQLCTELPPHIHSLQEQEQALSVAIREFTAKVFMSQKLCSSLRKKVSESETQLLTLHEAKLAAISGSDFATAKEVKMEIKSLCAERDGLEGQIKKLQALSESNSEKLEKMKVDHDLLKQELELKEAEFESNLKENAVKYIELLEDRLHSCGSQVVERVWEADLEACHLVLQGLQLRAAGVCSSEETEEGRAVEAGCSRHLCPPAETKEGCLSPESRALGGPWCTEGDLDHSELTKELEEFLVCVENLPEDCCSGTIAIAEQCRSISDKLLSLEDQLQTAVLHRDESLTQNLQKEIQTVKATLQAMLEQLKASSEEEDWEL